MSTILKLTPVRFVLDPDDHLPHFLLPFAQSLAVLHNFGNLHSYFYLNYEQYFLFYKT